jgi:predicted nucleotidyltransferase
VFGSLGRGNWDEYSDIDLNVVVADGVDVDPIAEWDSLRPVLAEVDERVAVVVPSASDAVDIVFESLVELSIRYHPLAATSPNIIDSAIVLYGGITVDDLAAATRGRIREPAMTIDDVLAACVRDALYCERSLYRNRPWSAAYALHRIQMGLMNAYGMTHGGFRGWMTFESDADPALQDRLAATSFQHTATSMRESLLSLIDVLEHHADAFTGGQTRFDKGGRVVLARLRERVIART